eukprot:CAMPEP_0206427416 /NCGR_PEP_ID=MMETSP0324_2-20121206/5023_1 /ASSEMBLY_ACC=CAM_ASM_000836 /TAXON_ID=2866 /ORGANISM="Crypthecodinium cohnii, Strain Seligo" /LENGTH=1420 /DNA_ID=CAMNT_0053892683 /DNA_START=234 /DNA_END=4496 /DNA_ORIENTATION=+
MASSAAPRASLKERLEKAGIDEKFHTVFVELTNNSADFLADVTAEDLVTCSSSDGVQIAMPVARGLVRKLKETSVEKEDQPDVASGLASTASTKTPIAAPKASKAVVATHKVRPLQANPSKGECALSLTQGTVPDAADADTTLVRCAVRGVCADTKGRQKLLLLLLDRSGSLAGSLWRRVVDAVASVVTDNLLSDPMIKIIFVVYSDQAREVTLPESTSTLREMLLSREYSPQGGTCFKAAFEAGAAAVVRELNVLSRRGVETSEVDIATLLFTDGEDTSVKSHNRRHDVQLVDREASKMAARTSGDVFRKRLQDTGCTSYVCIAAFGSDHDPDQCQYLSDRYCYINRGEVLADALAGGLGALLSSAGQCKVGVKLPTGISLEEPLPETLPLDSAGCLDHHIWLRLDKKHTASGWLDVSVSVGGAVVLKGSLDVASSIDIVAPSSFESQLFLIDLVALRLRRVARLLTGRGRVAPEELADLRERLTNAKDHLQPTRDAAFSVSSGVSGRAALRARLAEVEAARLRLSYALGQFDENDVNDTRTIGSVAIDAILRDAGQHLPQGPATASLVRRTDAAGALPTPETLSKYGAGYTTDAYSCCDAFELATQGDALFYQLDKVQIAPNGGFLSVEDSDGLIAHEAFVLLSKDGSQAVQAIGREDGFTHLGLPLYATEGHFLRAALLLPETLRRLSPGNVYAPGVSERQLLSLLGRSLMRSGPLTEGFCEALLHKARSVRAVLAGCASGASNEDGTAATLLDAVGIEARRFLTEESLRAQAPDLFAIAAAGLVLDDMDEAALKHLSDLVVRESLRRRVAHALRSAGDAEKLCLAVSLLGPYVPEADYVKAGSKAILPAAGAGELSFDKGAINPFAAPRELEGWEAESPTKTSPRPAGMSAILSLLSAKHNDNNLQPKDWVLLKQRLSSWGSLLTSVGGASNLFRQLDSAMLSDGTDEEAQAVVASTLNALRSEGSDSATCCIESACGSVQDVSETVVSVCLPTLPSSQTPRSFVASTLKALVEKRRKLVCQYPITGASMPSLPNHSGESVAEIWGAPANPTDPTLHKKAMLRVWRRTMKVRISMTMKEALADKEYRKRGGTFAFPSPLDTFIRGLHRRTMDLHSDWEVRLRKDTSGEAAKAEAVEEMLLRLRWDDSDNVARSKLKLLVGRIWDGLEGVDLSCKKPLSSALWLDENDEIPAAASARSAAAAAAAAAAAPIHQDGQANEDDDDDEGKQDEKEDAKEGATAAAAAASGASAAEAPTTTTTTTTTTTIATTAAAAANSTFPVGREAAEAAMDDDLMRTYQALDTDLKRRLTGFAELQRNGMRLKLPLALRAKQRKALHLWAEQQGLFHRSFGYRGRRRLHVSTFSLEGGAAAARAVVVAAGTGAGAPGLAAGGPPQVQQEEEFDWGAWQSDAEQEEDED